MIKPPDHVQDYEKNLSIQTALRRVLALADRKVREKFCDDNVMTVLRLQLRGLREQMNLTQAEMARALGVTQSRYSAIERGRGTRGITLATASRLARAFDCSVTLQLVPFSSQLFSIHKECTDLPHSYNNDVSLSEQKLLEIDLLVDLGRKQLEGKGDMKDPLAERRKMRDEQKRVERKAAQDGMDLALKEMGKFTW